MPTVQPVARRRIISGSSVCISDDQAKMLQDASMRLDPKRSVQLRPKVAAYLTATPCPTDGQFAAAVTRAVRELKAVRIGL
jgi:hypothetical protein